MGPASQYWKKLCLHNAGEVLKEHKAIYEALDKAAVRRRF